MARTILIVDDTESILEMVDFILQKAGYQVIRACNGEDAISKMDGSPIDMVITDLHMPKVDGIELCKEIRKMETYQRIPVLLLTTESQTQIKMEARKAGATGWLTKPFKTDKLLGTIQKLVR
jgi:two-component system chemotaxis response regulator CheY